MASNAAALRADELERYSTLELLDLFRTSDRAADTDAVSRELRARESKADQAEAQLTATLADATRKVQDLGDLRRASLAEAMDSAQLSRIAEEDARAVLKDAVAEIHEAGKRKQDELSAHLDAVVDGIQALRTRHEEDMSDLMAMVVSKTEARLKASFAKIHAPTKKKPAQGDAVPAQETSTEVAQQSKQRVVDMAMLNQEDRAAADGSGGKSLKRKAADVTPVQISGPPTEIVADIGVPKGFSPPTLPLRSSSLIYDKEGPCSDNLFSKAIQDRNKVSKGEASVETTSCKRAKLKEPTKDQAAHDEEHGHQHQVERFDIETVSKQGSGGSPCVGSPPGRGRGRSNTTASPEQLGSAFSLKRPSPVCSAPRPPKTVQKDSARAENPSQLSRNDGQAKFNIASGRTIPATTQVFELPKSSPLEITPVSGADIRSILAMESKGTRSVQNKTSSLREIDSDAEEASKKEGNVGTTRNNKGGASRKA